MVRAIFVIAMLSLPANAQDSGPKWYITFETAAGERLPISISFDSEKKCRETGLIGVSHVRVVRNQIVVKYDCSTESPK